MAFRGNPIDPGPLARFTRELRSLVDKRYRRAFRALRNLPRIEYRTLVDAGAHRGAFTDAFLELHRPSRVILVEPTPELAERLKKQFDERPGFLVVEAALSDTNGEANFEINQSDASSSLLKIDKRNSDWFGLDLHVARTIGVPTLTLPRLMEMQQLHEIDLLKLDLQGAERLVLTAAEAVLGRIAVIYSEVFFERLYESAWLFDEMNDYLAARGFKLCGLSNLVHARDGSLLQANATFRRM